LVDGLRRPLKQQGVARDFSRTANRMKSLFETSNVLDGTRNNV
jgi:hypothetical protein